MDPVPLIYITDDAIGEVCQPHGDPHSLTTSHELLKRDLLHLRRVMDDMSLFCRYHMTIAVSNTNNEKIKRESLNQLSSSDAVSEDLDNKQVLLAAVFPFPSQDWVTSCPDTLRVSTKMTASGTTTCSTKVNRQSIDGSDHIHEIEAPHEVALVSEFANVLDACGTWLSPDDFEAHVLAPTKALIEKQLGHLGSMDGSSIVNEDTILKQSSPQRMIDESDERNCIVERIPKRSRAEHSEHEHPGYGTSQVASVENSSSGADGVEAESQVIESCGSSPPAKKRLKSEQASSPSHQSDHELASASRSSPTLDGGSCALSEIADINQEGTVGVPSHVSDRVSRGTGAVTPPDSLEDCRIYEQHTADEIAFLLQDALPNNELSSGGTHMAKTSTNTQGQSKAVVLSSHMLLDIVWVPPSLGINKSRASASCTAGRPSTRGSACRTVPRLALPFPPNDPKESPLYETLQATLREFPSSCLAIWPALTTGSSKAGGVRVVNDRSERGEERRMVASDGLRESWSRLCGTLGATLLECAARGPRGRSDSQAMESGSKEIPLSQDRRAISPVDPGLLWRGHIALAETTSLAGEPSAAQSRVEKIHVLRGFALRAVGIESQNEYCSAEKAPTTRVHIGRTAADALANSCSLRVARIVPPAALVGVSHLLADASIAPGLELLVTDPSRFPGSAAFLECLASEGKGMLLVATGADAAGTMAERHCPAKGIVMACLPHACTHSTHSADEAIREDGRNCNWSITLFRRPTELSEDAITALIGEHRAHASCAVTPSSMEIPGGKDADGSLPGHAVGAHALESHVRDIAHPRVSAETTIGSLPLYSVDSLQEELAFLRETDGNEAPMGEDAGLRRRVPSRRAAAAAAAKSLAGISKRGAQKLAVAQGSRDASNAAASPGNEGRVNGGERGSPGAPRSPMLKALNAVMDARESRLDSLDRKRKVPSVYYAEVACDYVMNPSDLPSILPGTLAGADSATLSLYGSFGRWGQHGGYGWAEEALLPLGGAPRATSDRARAGREQMALPGGDVGQSSTACEQAPSSTPAGSASSLGQETKQPLSAVEEALERAGQQKRRRVKERKLVAREQRARLEQARPRSARTDFIQRALAGAGSTSGPNPNVVRPEAVRRASVNGGGMMIGGKGRARRHGSSAPSHSQGLAARSSLMGKLSRGSLILEKSVEAGATGSTKVAADAQKCAAGTNGDGEAQTAYDTTAEKSRSIGGTPAAEPPQKTESARQNGVEPNTPSQKACTTIATACTKSGAWKTLGDNQKESVKRTGLKGVGVKATSKEPSRVRRAIFAGDSVPDVKAEMRGTPIAANPSEQKAVVTGEAGEGAAAANGGPAGSSGSVGAGNWVL